MQIVLYTYDLCRGREHLMPWRTLFEVAKVMNDNNHNAWIINGCYHKKDMIDYEWQGIIIKSIKAGYQQLVDYINSVDADAIFIPFVWRSGLSDLTCLSELKGKKIAYLPGGVYSLNSAFALWRQANFAWAKPYILDSIVPKWILCRKLKRLRFDALIGLTDITAQCAYKSGFKQIYSIPPGHDGFENMVPDYSLINKYSLQNKKFLLFTGAPAPTRGVKILLEAIDNVKEDVFLVLLMRTDVGSEFKKLIEQLKKIKNQKRIIFITEKASREQLRAFFSCAYYVVLPFLVIPSEIPLTFFEVLSCGTPILTFHNGGTSLYMEVAMEISRKSVNGLSSAILKIWDDEKLRKIRSDRALTLMDAHPSWQTVGKHWLNIITTQE